MECKFDRFCDQVCDFISELQFLISLIRKCLPLHCTSGTLKEPLFQMYRSHVASNLRNSQN